VICALLCAGTFSACAGNDAAAGVHVSMKEMHFSPSALHVVAGRQTITAHNNGTLTHTFSINKLGQEVTVPPGKTRTLTLDLPAGTYRYVCRILDHEGLGMHGVLKVRSK
jgi:plastocyanin